MTNPEPREVLMVRSAAGEGQWSPIDPAVGRAGAERGQSWLRHQEGERHPVSGVTGAVMPRLAGERASHPRRTSQTYRPTIVFTNGYPDADATVQDAVERVERLREATGVWGYGALLEAEAELRDLGVTQ